VLWVPHLELNFDNQLHESMLGAEQLNEMSLFVTIFSFNLQGLDEN
jgi:hypothetical protein